MIENRVFFLFFLSFDILFCLFVPLCRELIKFQSFTRCRPIIAFIVLGIPCTPQRVRSFRRVRWWLERLNKSCVRVTTLGTFWWNKITASYLVLSEIAGNVFSVHQKSQNNPQQSKTTPPQPPGTVSRAQEFVLFEL